VYKIVHDLTMRYMLLKVLTVLTVIFKVLLLKQLSKKQIVKTEYTTVFWKNIDITKLKIVI